MKYSNTCIFGDGPPLPAGFYPLRHSTFSIRYSSFFLPNSGTHAGTVVPFFVAPPMAAVYPKRIILSLDTLEPMHEKS
jgi:hypothetical protein